jgi:flavin reductase (DIM6/NTAB) family NADH-FMN oxidoreductase RutF
MIDKRQFRDALGRFATGVAVITAKGPQDTPIGMTMSSFNSVSLDPPLVLFSVDRRAHSLSAILAAEGYAVNVLGANQQPLSDRFAQAGADTGAATPTRRCWTAPSRISSAPPTRSTMRATMSWCWPACSALPRGTKRR